MTLMSGLASDGIVESTLATAQCLSRVMLAMVLPRRLGHGAMSVSSHTGDRAIEVTWLRHDVGVDT
jgi:hypothetical protein